MQISKTIQRLKKLRLPRSLKSLKPAEKVIFVGYLGFALLTPLQHFLPQGVPRALLDTASSVLGNANQWLFAPEPPFPVLGTFCAGSVKVEPQFQCEKILFSSYGDIRVLEQPYETSLRSSRSYRLVETLAAAGFPGSTMAELVASLPPAKSLAVSFIVHPFDLGLRRFRSQILWQDSP